MTPSGCHTCHSWFKFSDVLSFCKRQSCNWHLVICSPRFWNHLSYSVLDAWLIVSGSGSGLFWDWIKIKDWIEDRLGSGYYILSPLHTAQLQKKKKTTMAETWQYLWSQLQKARHHQTVAGCWCYGLATKNWTTMDKWYHPVLIRCSSPFNHRKKNLQY